MPKPKSRQRTCPPPTAHRLAAWLSVARGLTGALAREVRFPPTEEDASALQGLWRQRLFELREAGVKVLQHRKTFELALACRPHAFAYAGAGKVCRLTLCPFCHAAEAAAGYERVRRALERHGQALGLVVNQVTARVDVDELAAPPDVVLQQVDSVWIEPARVFSLLRAARGSIVRYTAWPHDTWDGKAVLAARILAAVPREQADGVYAARRQFEQARAAHRRAERAKASLERQHAGREPDQEEEEARRPEGISWRELGIGEDVVETLFSGKYSVRPSPVSVARAVAHVFHYPSALLTAAPDVTAAVLDGPAGQKMSSVRGVFRTASSVHPSSYPLQFVRTCRKGEGVVGQALALLAEPDERLAARDVARTLGLPVVDRFAELAAPGGLRLYWLGKVDLPMRDLVRPEGTSLGQAVASRRPAQPGPRHALVGVTPGLGLAVFSTWPRPVIPADLFTSDAGRGEGLAINVKLGRVLYTLESLLAFRRRLARAMGS